MLWGTENCLVFLLLVEGASTRGGEAHAGQLERIHVVFLSPAESERKTNTIRLVQRPEASLIVPTILTK
jgi:hypothetical protein